MTHEPRAHPPRTHRLFFWLILGSLSVFFAEVVSGSDMFPYFHAWGLLAIMPLYTLHILVLSYVVFNYGKPNLYILFIAGAIFGMYEAYITKVLWNPPWGTPLLHMGGVAWIELVVLVLWWHPFMAFIIPLFLAENLLTRSKETMGALPEKLYRILSGKRGLLVLFLFAIIAGGFQSANSPSPFLSLASGLSTFAFLMMMIYVWKHKMKGENYSMRELLPRKGEFKTLLILLFVLYAIMGILLRPESVPGIASHMIIWMMYGGLFLLLHLHFKSSRSEQVRIHNELPISVSWKTVTFAWLTFILTSAALSLAGVGIMILLGGWIAGGGFGLYLLFLTIRDLNKDPSPPDATSIETEGLRV